MFGRRKQEEWPPDLGPLGHVDVHPDLRVTVEEVENARALIRQALAEGFPPPLAGASFDRRDGAWLVSLPG